MFTWGEKGAFKRREYVKTNIPLKILVENGVWDIQTEKLV
jgi:hypothetical protein